MKRAPRIALACTIALAAGSARAADRSVMAELMTATWCGYCPWAESALHDLEGEYDYDRFVVISYHVNDEYSNAESNSRISYYNISGTPTTAFDGNRKIVGGYDEVYDDYKNRIDADMVEEAQIELSMTGTVAGDRVDYTVLALADAPPDYVDPKLYVALGERGLIDDNEEMRPVVRRIVSHELAGLVQKGDEAVFTGSFAIAEEWKTPALEVVAFVQDHADRRIDQSTRLFFTEFASTEELVTAVEDSSRTINTYLTNPNSYPIDMRMQMEDLTAQGWLATFCILEWGICLPDSLDLTMPADSTVTVKLQWVDIGATDPTITSSFFMKYGENYDVIKGSTYTARSGAVALEVAELLIDDDDLGGSNGNGNGIPEPGEAIEFITRAHNSGPFIAYDVTSELTITDPSVIIIEADEAYGDIEKDATVDGSGGRFILDVDVVPGSTLAFAQTFTDGEGAVVIDTIYVPVGAVGIEGDDRGLPRPTATLLHQNQPNPFNPRTTLTYEVETDEQRVQLRVFDLSGREVKSLVDGPKAAGHHRVVWDGTNAQGLSLPSGVYLYRLTTGESSQTRRMLLLK
ncbi:MAG: hypothetical protein CME06_16765 [Gemmatimonadetes bacterium]|nr:hypothetical protein [Gemmatimonadota bacterium]